MTVINNYQPQIMELTIRNLLECMYDHQIKKYIYDTWPLESVALGGRVLSIADQSYKGIQLITLDDTTGSVQVKMTIEAKPKELNAFLPMEVTAIKARFQDSLHLEMNPAEEAEHDLLMHLHTAVESAGYVENIKPGDYVHALTLVRKSPEGMQLTVINIRKIVNNKALFIGNWLRQCKQTECLMDKISMQ